MGEQPRLFPSLPYQTGPLRERVARQSKEMNDGEL